MFAPAVCAPYFICLWRLEKEYANYTYSAQYKFDLYIGIAL